MDELSEKLSALLSSPDGMEKIKSVAALFGGDAPPEAQETKSKNEDRDQGAGAETLTALLSSLAPKGTQGAAGGGADPSMLLKMAPLFAKLSSSSNDPRVHLLESLRPILGKERQESLDMAVTFLKLSKLTDLLELL